MSRTLVSHNLLICYGLIIGALKVLIWEDLMALLCIGLGHEHFWTSGTDQGEEGSFFWFGNGKPITFTNWNAGEIILRNTYKSPLTSDS